METLEIKVPDNKSKLVKEFLKQAGVTIKVKKEKNTPNLATISAMEELKQGKGIMFKSVESLFNSI